MPDPDRVLVSRLALAFLCEHFGPDMTGPLVAHVYHALNQTTPGQPTCVCQRKSVVALLDVAANGTADDRDAQYMAEVALRAALPEEPCYCCGPGQCQGGCQCYERIPRPDHADPDHPLAGQGAEPKDPVSPTAWRIHNENGTTEVTEDELSVELAQDKGLRVTPLVVGTTDA